MKYTLDDFRNLSDKEICKFLANMADCCGYPDGGDCTLCPMHLYFGVTDCTDADRLYQALANPNKAEPIRIKMPKAAEENADAVKSEQCPNCKYNLDNPVYDEPRCSCKELKLRAGEWYQTILNEPRCIFFQRQNPVKEEEP